MLFSPSIARAFLWHLTVILFSLVISLSACGGSSQETISSPPTDPAPPVDPLPPVDPMPPDPMDSEFCLQITSNNPYGLSSLTSRLATPPYADVVAANRRGVLNASSDLSFTFNNSIQIKEGAILITPAADSDQTLWRSPYEDTFIIHAENLTLGGDNNEKLSLLSNDPAFFLPHPSEHMSLASRTLLRWDTNYTICNLGAIADADGRNLTRRIGEFITSPAPPLFVEYERTQELVHPITRDTVLPPVAVADGYAFYYSPALYNFTADDRLLNGTGVRIGIFDEGIYENTEVTPAVAFRAVKTANRFWNVQRETPAPRNVSRPQSIANHATNMARYLLNFAPGVLLYDFPFTLPNHLEAEINAILNDFNIPRRTERLEGTGLGLSEYVQLSAPEHFNLSIVSHSGSTHMDNITVAHIARAIDEGLIFAKALGNTITVPNTISDKWCSSTQNFIPYIKDLGDSKGAFVTLQAATAHAASLGIIRSLRSAAGDAAPYTLTLYENGNGATSEATATFSGMMALMMQENQLSEADFSPRQLVEILAETANTVPDNRTYFGNGLINMGKALAQVRRKQAPQYDLYADVLASPLFLNHGFNLTDDRDDCQRTGPQPPPP